MNLRTPMVVSLALLVALLPTHVVSRSAVAQEAGRATPVHVEPVRLRQMQARRMVTGELRAIRRSDVAAQEPGLVIEQPVRAGDLVEPGDVLARLDSRRLRILLDEVEADAEATRALLDERDAELKWRQRDLELLRSSFDRGAANPREIQDAESAVLIAQARLLQVERQIELNGARAALLRERLEDMTITAPFRGYVVARHVELGEWLGEGDAVVELVSSGVVEAWLDVPQRLLGAVQRVPGPVPVVIDATGERLRSSQRRIVTQVDPKARAFTLVLELASEQAALAPGMSVTAHVPTGEMTDHITVPKDALLRNEAGFFLYVARPAGERQHQAVPMTIEVLFGDEDWLAVRAPALREGDLVVVEGNERLFPMMPINPSRPTKVESPGGDG